MKIREQLIVAFLVLAIVPLTGIVLFSFFSSRAAVKHAVESESAALAEGMNERMAGIKHDLQGRLAALGGLPLGDLFRYRPDEAVAMQREMLESMHQRLGDAGALVESFTFVPSPPKPPMPPKPVLPPGAVERPFDQPGGADVGKDGYEYFFAPDTVPDGTVPSDTEATVFINFKTYQETLEDAGSKSSVVFKSEDGQTYALGIEGVGTEGGSHRVVVVAEEATRAETEKALREAELAAERAALAAEQAALAEARRQLDQEEARNRQMLRDQEAERDRRRVLRHQALKRRELAERERELRRRQGAGFRIDVREQGKVVGRMQTKLSLQQLIHRVLLTAPRDRGEVPFVFAEDELYTLDGADRERLASIGLERQGEAAVAAAGDWIIVTQKDEDSDTLFGVARPIGDSLSEIERTAVLNLIYGLALISFALVGILPLSRRITHGLEEVTAGAEQIAGGNLDTQVQVDSRNEIGQLAMAFNRMARELSDQQEKLVAQEARRQEEELAKRLLEAEVQRQSDELEEAREFQLSLLPKNLPDHPACDLAVDMRTATEVGGDYYDFHLADDGVLTLAVGDATGHGARAGTMVTAVKSLFTSAAGEMPPGRFLERATASVRRMQLGRMAMALVVARLEGNTLTVASAGMPPVLVRRGGGPEVEEVDLPATPLGGPDRVYREETLELAPGDLLLFLTDGFPELLNPDGEPLGYERLRQSYSAAPGAAKAVVVHMMAAAEAWCGGPTPGDDLTFVALKMR